MNVSPVRKEENRNTLQMGFMFGPIQYTIHICNQDASCTSRILLTTRRPAPFSAEVLRVPRSPRQLNNGHGQPSKLQAQAKVFFIFVFLLAN